jgi:hypothetical protein
MDMPMFGLTTNHVFAFSKVAHGQGELNNEMHIL